MKLLIADDEIHIRTGIQEGIEWGRLGIETVLIAANGLEAWDIFQKHEPQIVITDIKMPGIDGIMLSEKMLKRNPFTKIIILSGFAEFEYAQKAIQMGVMDYELKPIKMKSLIQLVNKAMGMLAKEEMVHDVQTSYMQYTKEKFIAQIVNGNMKNEILLKKKFMEYFSFEITGRILCITVEIESYEQIKAETNDPDEFRKNELVKFISNIIRSWFFDIKGTIIKQTDCFITFLCKLNYKITEQQFFHNLKGLFDLINQKLSEESHQTTVSFGVSESGDKFNLQVLYEHSLKALQFKLYHGGKSVYFFSEFPSVQQNIVFYLSNESELIDHIKNLNLEACCHIISNKFDNIKKNHSFDSGGIKTFCNELIYILVRTLKEKSNDITEIFKDSLVNFRNMKNKDTLDEYQEEVTELYKEILTSLSGTKGIKINLQVKRSLEYISKNFQNDISVDDIANFIGITPNYFSHLFKKDMRISFTGYLNKVRIKEAMKMMKTTNLLIYEIAEKVGYKDYKHFNQVFKKIEGSPPKKYR